MAPGAARDSRLSSAGRRPTGACGAAGACCAVFASQAISSNDTPEVEKGRVAGTRVAASRMRRITDPARMCIRRVRGRRKGDRYSRPFEWEGAARLSEVDMRVGGIVLVIWLIIGA